MSHLEDAIRDRRIEEGYTDGEAIELALKFREDGRDSRRRPSGGGCEVEHA